MAIASGIAFSHVGIHVADLQGMEGFYTRLLGLVVTDRGQLDTPRGPEGNRIELFCDTLGYVTQPMREPIDLSLSDATPMGILEARARGMPGFKPRSEWRAELARRMGVE